MDRKQILGLGLIVAIFTLFQIYFAPPKIEPETLEVSTPAPVVENKMEMLAENPIDTSVLALQAETIFLENEKIRVAIHTQGAFVEHVVLKNHKKYVKGLPKDEFPLLTLFDAKAGGLVFENLQGIPQSLETVVFQKIDSLSNAGKLVLEAVLSAQSRVRYTYSLLAGSNQLSLELDRIGMEQMARMDSFFWNWQMQPYSNEKSKAMEQAVSSIFYKPVNADRDYLSETRSDTHEIQTALQWVDFKTQYFSAFLIAQTPFVQGGTLKVDADHEYQDAENPYLKMYQAHLHLDALPSQRFTMYFGENDYHALADLGYQAESIVNFGWGIVRYINEYFVVYVFDFLVDRMPLVLALLLLTLVMKTLLFPLYYKSYKSSATMRVLRPELDELQKKYPKSEDMLKKQQAQMELYRKAGVNPLAGCLPMLIQMPILFAMFRFFPSMPALRQQSFLWADDLAGYDSVYELGFSIPLYGDHVSLLTILLAISMFFYTRMTSSSMPQQQEGMPDMRFMMYLFPFMSVFFFNNFSSGLSLYYLVANVISIVQMELARRFLIDEKAIRANIEENKKKPMKKSKWQERLEQYQNTAK